MCFGDWSRLDLFTNDDLEVMLEADDKAVKAGKYISDLLFVDDDGVVSLV